MRLRAEQFTRAVDSMFLRHSSRHVLCFRPLGHSWLGGNELTALDVGIFDKNTALKILYVDEGRWL